MGNGDFWEAVNELRKDVKILATEGCAHKRTHDSYITEIREERKERMEMGERLSREMKSIRNQILFGAALLMALTLVIDKVLK